MRIMTALNQLFPGTRGGQVVEAAVGGAVTAGRRGEGTITVLGAGRASGPDPASARLHLSDLTGTREVVPTLGDHFELAGEQWRLAGVRAVDVKPIGPTLPGYDPPGADPHKVLLQRVK